MLRERRATLITRVQLRPDINGGTVSRTNRPFLVDARCADVDLWFASVSAFTPWFAEFESILSLAERARAGAFRTRHLRTAYVVRHGLLRMILGRQWGMRCVDIQFQRTAEGKPFSPGAPQSFSVSHSGDIAAFAVSGTRFLGVDVEQVRPIPEFEQLALHYFSLREYRSLLALPREERERAFLACWTSKEAVLKATGQGIYDGLRQVEVSAASPAAALRIQSEDAAAWRLQSFVPVAGYLGAVAVKQAKLRLHCRNLNPELADLPRLSRSGASINTVRP